MTPEEQLKEDLIAVLGVSFHAAFSEAVEAPPNQRIWVLIDRLPRDDWRDVMEYVADKLQHWIDERFVPLLTQPPNLQAQPVRTMEHV